MNPPKVNLPVSTTAFPQFVATANAMVRWHKKTSTCGRWIGARIIAAGLAAALLLGPTFARADWAYTDVIDGVQHPLSVTPNTFNANTDSATDWSNTQADGDALVSWRFRDTSGPGVPSWNASAFTGFYNNGGANAGISDPPLYTLISGLQPGQEYSVRVYGIFPESATSRHGAEFSVDGAQAWTLVDRTMSDQAAFSWVDNATALGAPVINPSGDTRFYFELPANLTADSGGVGRIDVRLPQLVTGGGQDRFHLDGYAVLAQLPPPQPVFTNVTHAGGNILLQGHHGPPAGAYRILRSTDLGEPLNDWLDAGAALFDPSGNFSFTNNLPADTASFYRLVVLSPMGLPRITTPPQNQTVPAGQTASFNVTAEGAPPLHYQWYYNTNIVLTGHTNSTLTLTNAQPGDAGSYSVTVTNQFGSTNSTFAELTVTTDSLVAVPDGYATGTTGGGAATPITVSTPAAFHSAVNNDTPAVIIVQGRLDVGTVRIGSNKTILGADANSGLYGGIVQVRGTNYIFQNLTIGPSHDDAMEISGARYVFIHKCEFFDGADGNIDIVRQADFVTVSWCKFYYVNQTTHKFVNLIGNGDDVTADAGKLHVTMHHNWYAEGCRERMPRVRYGHVHVYNNYYNSVGNNYCIGIGVHCRIRVENCHFDNVNSPWADYGGVAVDGQIGWSGLKFTSASQPAFIANSFPVFTPPYAYTLTPVDDVKSLVTAGAGNVHAP
jgi:pectate lyase